MTDKVIKYDIDLPTRVILSPDLYTLTYSKKGIEVRDFGFIINTITFAEPGYIWYVSGTLCGLIFAEDASGVEITIETEKMLEALFAINNTTCSELMDKGLFPDIYFDLFTTSIATRQGFVTTTGGNSSQAIVKCNSSSAVDLSFYCFYFNFWMVPNIKRERKLSFYINKRLLNTSLNIPYHLISPIGIGFGSGIGCPLKYVYHF